MGRPFNRDQQIVYEIETTGTYEAKTVCLKVYMSPTEKDTVLELATGLGVSTSELFRRLLRKAAQDGLE
jgi:hypothetical protein